MDNTPPETNRRISSLGLSTLHVPAEGPIIADIILVHGLQGHPWHTWVYDPAKLSRHLDPDGEHDRRRQHSPSKSKRKAIGSKVSALFGSGLSRRTAETQDAATQGPMPAVFWPIDLLPITCPNARILVWGYDSVLAKRSALVNQSNLFAHAKDLLYALDGERPKGRKINDENAELADIVKSTKAVVFLGTPHRGSPGFQKIGDVASQVASILMMDTNPVLLRSLGLDSPELELSRESFLQQWRTYDFRVKTFQETYNFSSVKLGPLKQKVVPDMSSSLDDSRERAERLDADHRNMPKFWGCNDPNYLKVARELRSIMRLLQPDTPTAPATNPTPAPATTSAAPVTTPAAPATAPAPSGDLVPISNQRSVEEQESLKTLHFSGMFDRQHNIRREVDNTCEWLRESPVFKQWHSRSNVETDRGMLWIKGKPGAGKSTLMRHTAEWVARRESGQATVAAFYFNARGSVLEKSPVGFLRSILHQICLEDSSVRAQFLQLYRKRTNRIACGEVWSWSQPELEDFTRSIFRVAKPRPTFVFVDAIDECDTQTARELVYFLAACGKEAWQNGHCLNICMSSRHYPGITVPNCPEIIAEGGNKTDIETYIHDRFSFVPPDESSIASEIATSITEKAAGVFLWVVLIIDNLLQDFDAGQPISRLLERLKQVPKTMEDLYAGACRQLSAEERRFSLPLIQWVLFSHEKDWWDPYIHCDRILLTARLSSPEAESIMRSPKGTYVRPSRDRAVRRIKDASRGLLEVTAYHTVQFIHETAREFFLTGPGLVLLDPSLAENPIGRSYEVLVRGCLNALTHKLDDPLGFRANRLLITYAALVEKHGGRNTAILESICAGSYRAEEGSALRQASYLNLTSCVLTLLEQGVHPDDSGDRDRFSTPLVAVFLRHVEQPDQALITALLERGADPTGGDPTGPLHLAAGSAHVEAAAALLAHGAPVNAPDSDGCTPLMHAASSSSERAAKACALLLEHGADPNPVNANGQTALLLAAGSRRLRNIAAILKLLLEAGAEVNAVNSLGRNALHLVMRQISSWATERDLGEIIAAVRLLVDAGCDRALESVDWNRPIDEALGLESAFPKLGAELTKLLDPCGSIGDRESSEVDELEYMYVSE